MYNRQPCPYVRGAYIKYVANGIYSSYTPLKRITKKIEEIIWEEMDKIDGQEVSFPVVLPANLWEESGRYEKVGEELLRFSDRNNSKYVLGMTHEEAAVHLVRDYANSYLKCHDLFFFETSLLFAEFSCISLLFAVTI